MNIDKKLENGKLTLALQGRLDTTTAPQLEQELLENDTDGVTMLCLDFAQLDYISSAGLRVLLETQRRMNQQGSMVLCHVNETIKEVFDITGFSDLLTIE